MKFKYLIYINDTVVGRHDDEDSAWKTYEHLLREDWWSTPKDTITLKERGVTLFSVRGHGAKWAKTCLAGARGKLRLAGKWRAEQRAELEERGHTLRPASEVAAEAEAAKSKLSEEVANVAKVIEANKADRTVTFQEMSTPCMHKLTAAGYSAHPTLKGVRVSW